MFIYLFTFKLIYYFNDAYYGFGIRSWKIDCFSLVIKADLGTVNLISSLRLFHALGKWYNG